MVHLAQLRKGVSCMYSIRYVMDHIEVFGADGTFLFSADNMQEANEMMEE